MKNLEINVIINFARGSCKNNMVSQCHSDG